MVNQILVPRSRSGYKSSGPFKCSINFFCEELDVPNCQYCVCLPIIGVIHFMGKHY